MNGQNEKYFGGELFGDGEIRQIILFLFVLWNQLSGSPRLSKATLVSLEYLRDGDQVDHP